MALTLLLFVMALLLAAIIWWYVVYIRNYKYLNTFGGPRPLPIVGHILKLHPVQDVVNTCLKARDEFGNAIQLWLGYQPRLAFMAPKFVELVLSSSTILDKSFEYKFFNAWLGNGLLVSSGAKWRSRRKLLTPAFHFKILEQYIGIFESQSNTLIENLHEKVGQGPFDVFPFITLCTLDVICEAAMGTQVNAQKDSESEYVRSVKEMCRIIWERSLNPVKFSDYLFVLTKDYWKQRKALKILHGYTNSVILKRREKLLLEKTSNETSCNKTGVKQKAAFLDLLLQYNVDGESLSNECIREEVDTFMFEGHDTTASGISFALYSLAKHPKIQEKVFEELRNIFAEDKMRATNYQDLQNMKYLEMAIKESLRLYPPVPIFSRILSHDTELDNGVLPKNLNVTVFALGLHTNPEVFPNPEAYDPERFSKENCVERSPYAYVPFSAGPRNCIGQKFAVLEMKSIISKVLRNFEVLPVGDHKPALLPDVILKSLNGLPVILRERTL